MKSAKGLYFGANNAVFAPVGGKAPYCSDDEGALITRVLESWRTLRRAAELRHHEDILGIQVNSPDKIPEVYYHRKCRSIFTMKGDLMNQRRIRKIWN